MDESFTYIDGILALLGDCFQLSETRGGTPKKKVVSFLTPDGEEIRNKTQLNKYLKAHPGTVVVTDFDWGSPGLPTLTVFAIHLVLELRTPLICA